MTGNPHRLIEYTSLVSNAKKIGELWGCLFVVVGSVDVVSMCPVSVMWIFVSITKAYS